MFSRDDRCEYVIRRAGQDTSGNPIGMDGYGDQTEICGAVGRPVPHTFRVKRPGLTNLTDLVEGTVIRCPQHESVS